MKKFFTAFTLAEVLIALGIIGVVAAITIPALVNSYQNSQNVAQLKKAYTNINQAVVELANDNGCAGDLKCSGLFDINDYSSFADGLANHLKLVKNCGYNTGEGCFAPNSNLNFDGSSGTNYNYDTYNWYYKFITEDGMSFAVQSYVSDSSWADCAVNWSLSGSGNMSQTCGEIFVDINGPQKGPNNFGRDTFKFYITNGKGASLYPSGGSDDYWYDYSRWWNSGNANLCSASNPSGWECPGRIMEKGWTMDY